VLPSSSAAAIIALHGGGEDWSLLWSSAIVLSLSYTPRHHLSYEARHPSIDDRASDIWLYLPVPYK